MIPGRPYKKKKRSRTAAAYGDNVADPDEINQSIVSSVQLIDTLPMPRIEEQDQEADAKSNRTQLTDANHDATESVASKSVSQNKATLVDSDCKWCQIRDDGSKCIVCDLNDGTLFTQKR